MQDKLVAGFEGHPPAPGATIIPIICSSDETHLTSFTGDKKSWPIYMTLGNFHASNRQQTSNNAYMVVGILSNKPKLRKTSSKVDEEYRQINRECLLEAMARIFGTLIKLPAEGVVMDCPDGRRRQCFPILSAWCADHMENAELHGCMTNGCPKCIVPVASLGEYLEPGRRFPTRDGHIHNIKYKEYQDVAADATRRAELKDLKEWFNINRARPMPNVLSDYPFVEAHELHAPDLLHNLYLGLFKHVCDWMDDFLAYHNLQAVFDDVWMNIRPYPNFRHMNKPYRQISQWTGMDLLNLGRVIVPAFAATLEGCTAEKKPYFYQAIACISSLIGFSMMVGMRFVWESDFEYMENYLKTFHDTKRIFLQFRVGTGARSKAKAARNKIVIGAKAVLNAEQERLKAEKLPPISKAVVKARTAAWTKEGDEKYEAVMEECRNFDFIKLHLMSHMQGAIRRKGSNNGTDTQNSEMLHQVEAKKPWENSNKNARAQFFMRVDKERADRFNTHCHELQACMRDFPSCRTADIQEALNLFKPADRREVNALRRKNLPIPAGRFPYHDYAEDLLEGQIRMVLMSPVGDTFYAERESMTGYNQVLFEYLCEYLADNTAIVLSEEEAKKINVREYKILELTKQPYHPYHGCKVEKQIIRCYNKTLFRGKFRNDDIFTEYAIVDDEPLEIERSMKNLEVARLVRLYQFWVNKPDGRLELRDIHRVALVQYYEDVNGGMCEDQSGLCRVRERAVDAEGWDLQVVSIDRVFGAAHIVEIPRTNHKGATKEFFVNNTADLRLFNTIYSRPIVVEDLEGLDEEIVIDDNGEQIVEGLEDLNLGGGEDETIDRRMDNDAIEEERDDYDEDYVDRVDDD